MSRQGQPHATGSFGEYRVCKIEMSLAERPVLGPYIRLKTTTKINSHGTEQAMELVFGRTHLSEKLQFSQVFLPEDIPQAMMDQKKALATLREEEYSNLT